MAFIKRFSYGRIYILHDRRVTQDPNGNDIENCQMLGIAKGKDKLEAKNNLLKDNPWISEAGFNRSEFIVRQLVL